jgi:hypothetical protein
MELFDSWKLVMQPTLQTAHEYEGAARDFVDFFGDIPVEDIEQNDLLDYRDEARHLASTMPKADRALSFTELLDRHRRSDAARIGAPMLKKRIGGIQALLSFAKGQKWISRNEGRDVPVMGYTKSGTVSRQAFQEDELRLLFTSRLFTAPYCGSRSLQSAISDACLCWSAAISDNDSTASPAFCSIRNRSIPDGRG